MTEANTDSDFKQLRVFCRGERASFDAEAVSGTPYECRVTDGLGRSEQQQPLCCLRELTDAPEIVPLDVARKVCCRQETKAAFEFRRSHALRQIDQSKRVAPGFPSDAVADAVVEPNRDGPH